MIHIVLFQPEIPQNTGNIGRTCVALRAKLWLVEPCGFRLDEARLRRAGLDYWPHLQLEIVPHWDALLAQLANHRMWFVTKFAERSIYQAAFESDDVLVFGSESVGLPPSIHEKFSSQRLHIPMVGETRSLNLATSVGIVAYEAFRQVNC